MFRFLETRLDPFAVAGRGTQPNARAVSFIVAELKPLRRVTAASLVLTTIVAGIEIWPAG